VGWTEGASWTHGERGARDITGVWKQSPQRGSGPEPLVRGSGGEAPLKLRAFCRWTTQTRGKICHFSLVFLKPPVSHKWCLEWIELVNFLPWSRFLITVSSPACVGDRKSLSHTSRPNSYWIIGEQQASEWESSAKRYIYSQAAAVRVCWLPPTLTVPPPKNSPDLHQSQEWSLAKVGWTCPPRGDAPA